MNWYMIKILMPDNRHYVGIDQEPAGEILGIYDSEEKADRACREYALTNRIPEFAEYQEV